MGLVEHEPAAERYGSFGELLLLPQLVAGVGDEIVCEVQEEAFLHPNTRSQNGVHPGHGRQVEIDHGRRKDDVRPVLPEPQLGDPFRVGEA